MASVRRLLLTLGIGLLIQRGAQLVALLALARTLGQTATGIHAQGVAIGGLLAMLASAGMRNPVARALAQSPQSARLWLQATIRLRLERAAVLAVLAATLAFALTAMPWFWTLCALQVVPAAFDLKFLGDAVARTRREVGLETLASFGFATATCIWLAAGGTDLTVLAGMLLACRALYAAGAARTVASLPADGPGPDRTELRRVCRQLTLPQVFGCLCIEGDVWIVARIGGDAVAGLYAVAARIAGAAGMPTAQLMRLLFAHQLHAAQRGDAGRTMRVALRATALLLVPILAGGLVVADDLCLLFGAPFGSAGPALRWLLLATAAQHLGWQGLQALLASGRDRQYSRALWLQSGLQLVGIAVLTPGLGAAGAAAATALSQLAFAAATLRAMDGARAPLDWLAAPLRIALATAAAAALCGWAIDTGGEPWAGFHLPAQLLAGGIAAFAGIYRSELRQRWQKIGAGLSEASGFR